MKMRGNRFFYIALENLSATWMIKTSLSADTYLYSNVWHQYKDDCKNTAVLSSHFIVLHIEYHGPVEGVLRFDS